MYVLSESFLRLPLRPIFRQSHPNFITVRTAYASEIWAQLTKNLLTKSGTERFRENISYILLKLLFSKLLIQFQEVCKELFLSCGKYVLPGYHDQPDIAYIPLEPAPSLDFLSDRRLYLP